MALTFNEALHTYCEDGKPVWSVSRVLRESGLVDPDKYCPGSADRGRAVHLACQYLDEGDLEESSVPEALAGYLKAYKSFLMLNGWRWTGIEERRSNKQLGYAGTIDRVADGLILDLKSGVQEATHALQLAAYAGLFEQPMALRRFCLYLAADGSFKLKEYPRNEFPHDWAVFQSVLNVCIWKEKHNGNGGSRNCSTAGA